MNKLKTFTPESEAERRNLFDKVKLGNVPAATNRYLSFSGVLPVSLPDGIRVLFLPDTHAPAHNKLIYWAMFQFMSWYRPHMVVFIGDVNDLFALSMWPKPPRTSVNPQGEIDDTRRLIYKVLKHGPYWVVVIDGNHEDRMIRWLTKFSPQFAHYLDPVTREPVVSLHQLMGFRPDDPVTFITGADQRGGFEGGLWINDHFKAEHGSIVKPTPGDSARGHAEKHHRDTAIGHTHRMGASSRQLTGDTLTGVELGCLVDWDHPFFAYSPSHDWHHGFGVGTVFGGKLHVQPVPIIGTKDESGQLRYVFTYADKVFTSSDR